MALVAPSGAGAADYESASSLADASADDRRTLLANLSPDRGLDEHLGVPEGEGLLQLGGEGLSLRDVARRPPGRRFVYLPSGSTGGGSPARHAGLLALMIRTEERIREQGGRLLLYVPDDAGWAEPLADVLGGAVLLGDAARPPDAGDALPTLARFPAGEGDDGPDAPSPETAVVGEAPSLGGEAGSPGDGEDGPPGRGPMPLAVPAEGSGEEEGGDARDRGESGSGREERAWRRHRRSGGLPTARIVVGGLVVAALAAGWWWFARSALPEDPGRTRDAAAREAGDAAPAGSARSTPPPAASSGERTAPPPGAEDVAAAAPELPYSVLIASYAQWEQARRRLRRWREPGGDVYFVAPTRVRGGLYWRLFAGALPDRPSATALMERLVEEGRKDRVRAWDVRPAGLAFRVSVEGDREAAASRAEEMSGRGLPAYVLAATADGDTVWQVYSGGFESPGAAADLQRMLGESEIEAELVPRRGESGSE